MGALHRVEQRRVVGGLVAATATGQVLLWTTVQRIPAAATQYRAVGSAVYDVLEYLAAGMCTEDIDRDFPELTPDSFRSVFEFAVLRERRLATT